ncbi:peptidase inhibitor family I36 protein [Actinokineospora spheciospongiae]|uniref:peptidase inhibitor family I36 protein n=1 Tax=Actinokineospora spheciospongiae TaxID=909613 RepID=UPI000D71071A|nr:peptidase inhibitor family I36 protein [Actinokineospora spheciospongiae]PWW66563.1 peptidase inhibitor family I36 [Actinokineospora spheciospongiae]
MGKRLVRTAAALAGTIALIVSQAGTATAATPGDGVCDEGEFCLYWGQDQSGALADFTATVADYGDTAPDCQTFTGPGPGLGACVKNNATSAWNRSTTHTVTVHFDADNQGAADTVASGQKVDLAKTWLENASHEFTANPAPQPTR